MSKFIYLLIAIFFLATPRGLASQQDAIDQISKDLDLLIELDEKIGEKELRLGAITQQMNDLRAQKENIGTDDGKQLYEATMSVMQEEMDKVTGEIDDISAQLAQIRDRQKALGEDTCPVKEEDQRLLEGFVIVAERVEKANDNMDDLVAQADAISESAMKFKEAGKGTQKGFFQKLIQKGKDCIKK